MISYVVIFVASYYAIYKTLPLLQDPMYSADTLAQVIRHLIIVYLTTQLSNFVWRQKFVSRVAILNRSQTEARQLFESSLIE